MYLITVQDLDVSEYFLLDENQWITLPPDVSPAEASTRHEKFFTHYFESAMEMINFCQEKKIAILDECTVLSMTDVPC